MLKVSVAHETPFPSSMPPNRSPEGSSLPHEACSPTHDALSSIPPGRRHEASSPIAFEGSYQVFNHWREALEELSGLHLRLDAYAPWHLEGRWERLPHDPLTVILVHQDAFGIIPHRAAGPLADRLQGILDTGEEPDEWDYAQFTGTTHRFIAGLRTAHSQGENLIFH